MEFNLPKRFNNSHKGTYGRVLNISGSKYMRGAAYLSSLSALKIGCGYLVLCSTEEVLNTVSILLPEAVLTPISSLDEELEKADVILVGCGLSTDENSKKILNEVFEFNPKIPTIVDADGLNILSKTEYHFIPENLILTPHPMEVSRLLDISVDEILEDTVSCAKAISKKYNCTTVLKGHNTVVSSKYFEIYINKTGNSALSKAGTGDILSGMIAGLCAQKANNFEAAKCAVYLHGLAGEIASKKMTEYSVLASDLPEFFPDAIRSIV